MIILRKSRLILCSFALCILLVGCATQRKSHHSSSVFQYLYAGKEGYVETSSVPALSLPLRVGIAFVPETSNSNHSFTERDKMELMKKVSRHFKNHVFVKSVDLIPSAYLTYKGSFTNLDQLHTMYGIDVISLLSYDQTQFTDEGLASITYWTIVGAYIVPGEKNDTHTMVDAAVYDIKSRKMLFRAPGVSHIKGHATPVNLTEQLRRDRLEGFKNASDDLVTNLKIQLEAFKEKIKETPQDYRIIHKPDYVGAGSLDASFLILLGIAGGCWLWTQQRKRA